jgi:hypothetical protein
MQTIVHVYDFDAKHSEADRAAYEELCTKLEASRVRPMISGGGASHYRPDLDGVTVELETEHLFDNQWNTAPLPGADKGLRLFDWAQDAEIGVGGGGWAPKGRKRGHWLEQTPEMREIRRNTLTCGYCGKQEAAPTGHIFCPHCIGSEYLKATELRLTRMIPVDESGPRAERAELTDAEREHLLPRYREAQLHGHTERDKARIAKALVVLRYFSAMAATAEHDGMLWLMDHGVRTDNVIYYPHTERFSFGWRNPVDDVLKGELLGLISEFRWPYEIKCADGRTLEGNIG